MAAQFTDTILIHCLLYQKYIPWNSSWGLDKKKDRPCLSQFCCYKEKNTNNCVASPQKSISYQFGGYESKYLKPRPIQQSLAYHCQAGPRLSNLYLEWSRYPFKEKGLQKASLSTYPVWDVDFEWGRGKWEEEGRGRCGNWVWYVKWDYFKIQKRKSLKKPERHIVW